MEEAKKKNFELYNISKFRDVLFGISTLWIMLFHSGLLNLESIIHSKNLIRIINYIKELGNCGVDIFLLLSGIGLYFSYSKDSNILNFYKKRAIRILPPVIIVVILYYAIMGNVTLKQYLDRIFLLSFFNDKDYNFWYFSLIVLLYFIYPLLHKLIKRFDIKALILSLSAILVFNFTLMKFNYQTYGLYEIALTRLPVFFIGVYLGKKVYNNDKISKKFIYLFAFIFIFILVFLYVNSLEKYFFIKRYLYCPFAISLVLLVSNTKRINNLFERFLVWIGGYSMEIYLIYENLARIMNEKIKIFTFNDKSYISFYIAIFVITIIFSIALKSICNELNNKVFKKTVFDNNDIKKIKNI